MIKVYLGDLKYNVQGAPNDCIPLNLGYVATYAQASLPKELDFKLFKDPDKMMDAVRRDHPKIIGLSAYPWNTNVSTEFIRCVKREFPTTVTVMGGPNYSNEPDKQCAFLAKRPQVDFFVYLEGEIAFVNLIKRYMQCEGNLRQMRLAPIDGVHQIDPASGSVLRGRSPERIAVLDTIPSPYLAGLFDEMMGEQRPMLQTTRGCPFTCTFCVEGNSYYTKVRRFSAERIRLELEYIADRVPKHAILNITDSNFAMFKEDLETCQIIRRLQDEKGWPYTIACTTGKNAVERIIEAVKITRGAVSMSMQVQSTDPEVLAKIKRKNISFYTMAEASQRVKSHTSHQRTVSALILGLPEETKDSHLNSIKELLELEMDYICAFSLILLEGTELGTAETFKRFGVQSKFRIISNNFGRFNGFDGIEVEEICVGTDTLSFEDYLDLRRFHFFLNCFHADRIFEELLHHLRLSGVPVFDFLLRLKADISRAPEPLRLVYENFAQAARSELFDSEDEIYRFWQSEDNKERVLAGEVGNNLLFTARAEILMKCFREVAHYACDVAKRMIIERGGGWPAMEEEFHQLAEYMGARRRLMEHKKVEKVFGPREFDYDFERWGMEGFSKPLQQYRVACPARIEFFLTEELCDELVQELNFYGWSGQGISRWIRWTNPMRFVRQGRVVTLVST